MTTTLNIQRDDIAAFANSRADLSDGALVKADKAQDVAQKSFKAQQKKPTSVWGKLKKRFTRIKVDEDKNVFKAFVRSGSRVRSKRPLDVYAAVRYCNRLAEEGTASALEQQQVMDLIERFSTLPREIFDPAKALAGKEKLQRLLSPKMDSLYRWAEIDPQAAESEEFQLNMNIAKAELAARLNHGMKPAGAGVNGAMIMQSLEGDVVGVFKPTRELRWYQLSENLKNVFGQARLLSKKTDAQELAEAAAYSLDRVLGFNIAPAAKMCQITGDSGAFLAFLGGYKTAEKASPELSKRSTYSAHEQNVFQKACLYDFLTGNMDCHGENMFMRVVDGKLKEVRIIDHGNSFIEYNPGTYGSKGNQYAWGSMKIAKDAFTPETIAFIEQMKEDDLHRFIEEYRKGFLSENMTERLVERFRVLKDAVATGEIKNPRQLSAIRTDADFQKLSKKMLKPEDFLVIDVR